MEALSWLYDKDDPSVEDAKAFIKNHPDALMGIEEDDGYNVVPLHQAIYWASDEVILLLLEACPRAAKTVDCGHNVLHYAIGVINVYGQTIRSEEVIKALLNAHPGAASERRPVTRNLPLHDAVNMNASEGIILLLLNAYPQAAFVEMKDGRLLVEICLEKKASDDLMREICKVRVRVDGLLPLGVVLTKRSSDDIVLAVLKAYPEAAEKRFSTNCDECILPLHIAYEDEHSEPVKDALRRAYPDAEKENPFETTHQLHKFLENEPLDPDGDYVENLIEKYPEAAGKRGRDSRLPLHIAIDRIASVSVTWMLFQAYPQAGKEKMKDGRLPIEVFAEQKVTDDWPQVYLTIMATGLLKNDMPVSIEDGTPVEHSDSWHACISYSTETATCAVRKVLLESENRDDDSDYDSDDSDDYGVGFGKHIHALADACDYQGRTALGLAAKGPRAEINKHLLLCGQYMLKMGPPEHRSKTSVVLRAQDLGEQSDYGVTFDKADKDKNGKLDRKELKTIANSIGLDPDMFLKGSEKSDESISKGEFVSICKRHLGDGPREVVIKLMQKKDHWKRECNARTKNTLHPKYVVSALSNVPSDTEIADAVKEDKGGLETIVTKFLGGNKPGNYAIVMIAADRNLHEVFHQEQPDIDDVRVILKQVFEAVKHLHGQKLMHGDIKMLNIVRSRIDNGLRLIDLDASARIVPRGGDDETFAGAKFSSAVLPPEMIKRIETEEQLEKFKKYWESEIDEDLKKKVEPKPYKKQGTVKARYVVKSFRTEEGKPTTPVFEGLPYEELVHASENIDVWSLGVLAFTLLTGEPLIPSNRDDDCASGNAMHVLYYWGTQPEVLSELFNKIHNVAARDLVQQLLQYEPGRRPSVVSLLEDHPFFNPQNADILEGINDINAQLKDVAKNRQDDRALWERIDANVVVIKKLSVEGKDELRRTRHVLLRGIFEAADVRTPTTFIILNNKLPPAADPSDEEAKNKILKIVTNEDGSGVSVTTKHATFTATEEGVGIGLEGDLKEYRDQVEAGVKWAKRIKNIGKNVAAGEIGKAFEIINKGIEDLIVGNEMYLYLIDELTGLPVRAEGEGWPIVITEPSELVHKLLPLMQLGMRAMCFYNGTAGLVRMFGYPAPKVPKEWSKGAQETVELLKHESSVGEFSVLHEEVKEGSGEKKSVRGKSLRTFVDFLKKEDPGLKVGKTGHFAGLQIIGDPEEGTAVWTMLTDPGDINSALKERAKQRKEEERTQNEHTRQQKEAQEQISETEEVPTLTSEEMNTNQTRNTPKDMVTEEVDKRNNVVASEEIVELTKAAKEATASAKEATAAAKEATAAAKEATAAAKEAVSASSAGKACCAIM